MESIWSKTVSFPNYPALTEDKKAEAVVIGAGMAGILTAALLQERGIDTIILEANTVAGGQTKNTTAKVTSQHGLIYHKLIQTLGTEPTQQYASAQQEAIVQYARLIKEKRIDCHWEVCPAYLYSVLEKESLEKEAEAARLLGISSALAEKTVLPFPVKAALRFDDQAQFHPLSFLQGLLHPLKIYEHTRVLTVEKDQVITEKGVVTANHIIFACHYPFINAPGYYFMRMHQERSYVLALEGAMELSGMYLGIDQKDTLSFRSYGKTLLLGGGAHRAGENRRGGQYEALRKKAGEFWPGCREIAHWSAQDCMSLDSVPYIGQYSAAVPNWHVATGFHKWGMTNSMVAAQIISGQILKEEPPYSLVFSPQRFTPSASAKSLLSEGAHAVRDLSRRIFAPPRADIDALPVGHGGVVESSGEKMGVYKDEMGEVFIVSIRCPHLGCQLEWNPDEKTWDCPCHGSRFDFRGNLLNNPAQEDLPHA